MATLTFGYAVNADGGMRAFGPSAPLLAGETAYATQPAPPTPTLAQQAAVALAAGLAVTSTATPALNATYACDPDTISNVQAEVVSFLLNGAFTNGASTIEWPDMAGGWHAFTVAQFKALATALAAYIGALKPIIARNAGTLPAASTTIP